MILRITLKLIMLSDSRHWPPCFRCCAKAVMVLLLLIFSQLNARAYSQDINLSVQNASMEEVLKTIEKQSGYYFVYNIEELRLASLITLDVRGATVEQVLDKCFADQPLTYKIVSRNVVITLRNKKASVYTPPINIVGVVRDSDNEPIPGVNIRIKGTNTGSVTDVEGRFSLEVPDAESVLIFSFIGFETQEVTVGSSTSLEITLKQSTSELNEIVIVGYGEVSKTDLTGAVGQVEMEDLINAPVASFTDALAGRVAGVQVSASDGQPGEEGLNIVIRGAGSITQSTAPLYVVDGFPIEDFDAGSLSNNDIESINILKDASATAIYGARGANGVIVIETKKGKVGKPVVTFNANYGFQQIRKEMDLMSPYDFVKYHLELNPTRTQDNYLQDGRTLDYYKGVEGINWQDLVMDRRPLQTYSMAVRGGSDRTKYSISGSIFDQNGVVTGTGYKRYQGRFSLDQDINNKIKAGITANYSYQQTFGHKAAVATSGSNVSSYLFYNIWGYRPVSGSDNFDLITEDVDDEFGALGTIETRVNPLKTMENVYRNIGKKDLLANMYVSYEIVKGLTFKSTGGFSIRQSLGEMFYNSLTPQGSPKNPRNIRGINGAVSFSEVNTWSNENTLTYNKKFNKNHKIIALLGFSSQMRKTKSYGVGVQDVPNEELGVSGLDEGIPYSSPASSSEFGLVSFFGRLNYNYKSRYLFTATYRADGSSKFAPGNKWGFFPSAAFAWNMSDESFMRGLRPISTSKVRLSYGVTGNNRVSDFAYLPGLTLPNTNSYSFNNGSPSKGVVPAELGNSALQWENIEQIDIGYDLGLFNERIQLTVDLYRKTTKDLLLNALLPPSTGFVDAYKNIGRLKNEGLEISLNTVNINTGDFRWSTGFNISFNRNKVLELTRGQEKLFSTVNFESQYNSSNLYIAEIGKPVALFYGFVFDGVYQYEDFDNPAPGMYTLKSSVTTNGDIRENIQPGDIKYRDINGDLVVDDYDQVVIGRAIPIHTGGFTNSLRYKNFDLNIFFQWSYGNDIMNANRLLMEGNALLRSDVNQFASYANRWTPENPSNKYYRTGGQGPFGRYSSRTLEDGSYLRLKTIALGYNLPSALLERFRINTLRFTVSAQNLITWTNYSGMDPEVSSQNSVLTPGFDYSAYPHAQTLMFGVNASF